MNCVSEVTVSKLRLYLSVAYSVSGCPFKKITLSTVLQNAVDGEIFVNVACMFHSHSWQNLLINELRFWQNPFSEVAVLVYKVLHCCAPSYVGPFTYIADLPRL